jgi:protein-tyrosine phosphatase
MSKDDAEIHPFSGPLRIDEVELPGSGVLGLCHCPGRRATRPGANPWARDLGDDLEAIRSWGATRIVTLIEATEFTRLGVPDLPERVASARLGWHHVPIPDMHAPTEATLAAWSTHGPAVHSALARGERVVVHCAAGLGRTGLFAAKLLVARGVAPDEAIRQVRAARRGTIETAAQEADVRTGPSLKVEGT